MEQRAGLPRESAKPGIPTIARTSNTPARAVRSEHPRRGRNARLLRQVGERIGNRQHVLLPVPHA